MKSADKRFLKYFFIWLIVSALALVGGISYVAQIRGYSAIGSEWASPLLIGLALYIAWNRKRWISEISDAYNSDWLD